MKKRGVVGNVKNEPPAAKGRLKIKNRSVGTNENSPVVYGWESIRQPKPSPVRTADIRTSLRDLYKITRVTQR